MIIHGLSNNELMCEEYYIAYFDVLGTKASLKKDTNETLTKLWEVTHFIKKHRSEDIIIRSFSDNILFAVRIDRDNHVKSLNSLFNAAASFVAQCLLVYELLVRGAIVKGLLHIDSEIVIGESLIRAYELESKIAVYPRIIIDKNVLDNVDYNSLPLRKFDKPFFKDTDSLVCINPLFFFDMNAREAMKNRIVYNIINSAILSHDDSSMAKIEWIKNYVNDFYVQNHGSPLVVFDNNLIKKL